MTTKTDRTEEIEIRLNRARWSIAGIVTSSVSPQMLDISQFAASKTIALVGPERQEPLSQLVWYNEG